MPKLIIGQSGTLADSVIPQSKEQGNWKSGLAELEFP